ncbi:MAG: DNA polymerase III subunit delta, partial [Desulfuromonadales bacterium]|nr:DNA polymerase III subunit delta [Desulfuromonadales bacterium]
MKPAELDKAIADHSPPPLLLLYGEEPFLLDQALARLRGLIPPDARDFNFQMVRGREVRAAAVLDTVHTFPVFSSRRLVLVRETEEIPAAELEAFLPYLRAPVAETILVFTAEKIDGRRKFYQEFRKHGAMVEFRRLFDNQIPAFVREQARVAGFSFTEDAMTLFCRRVGTSLQEVAAELGKLGTYLGGKKLADVAEVTAVVSDTRVDSIFDLTNAIGLQKTGDALRLLSRLLGEGVAPLVVLTMLTRHFRQLWMARELLDLGEQSRQIAGRIGVNPYFLDTLLVQARQFGPDRYRHAFELFLGADLALKSSGAHPGALLE